MDCFPSHRWDSEGAIGISALEAIGRSRRDGDIDAIPELDAAAPSGLDKLSAEWRQAHRLDFEYRRRSRRIEALSQAWTLRQEADALLQQETDVLQISEPQGQQIETSTAACDLPLPSFKSIDGTPTTERVQQEHARLTVSDSRKGSSAPEVYYIGGADESISEWKPATASGRWLIGELPDPEVKPDHGVEDVVDTESFREMPPTSEQSTGADASVTQAEGSKQLQDDFHPVSQSNLGLLTLPQGSGLITSCSKTSSISASEDIYFDCPNPHSPPHTPKTQMKKEDSVASDMALTIDLEREQLSPVSSCPLLAPSLKQNEETGRDILGNDLQLDDMLELDLLQDQEQEKQQDQWQNQHGESAQDHVHTCMEEINAEIKVEEGVDEKHEKDHNAEFNQIKILDQDVGQPDWNATDRREVIGITGKSVRSLRRELALQKAWELRQEALKALEMATLANVQEQKIETAYNGVAEKLTEQAKKVAAERKEQAQQSRQIYTPKQGVKSLPTTPVEKKLAGLGYAPIGEDEAIESVPNEVNFQAKQPMVGSENESRWRLDFRVNCSFAAIARGQQDGQESLACAARCAMAIATMAVSPGCAVSIASPRRGPKAAGLSSLARSCCAPRAISVLRANTLKKPSSVRM